MTGLSGNGLRSSLQYSSTLPWFESPHLEGRNPREQDFFIPLSEKSRIKCLPMNRQSVCLLDKLIPIVLQSAIHSAIQCGEFCFLERLVHDKLNPWIRKWAQLLSGDKSLILKSSSSVSSSFPCEKAFCQSDLREDRLPSPKF